MVIKGDYLQWYASSLIKNLLAVVQILCQFSYNWEMNIISQLLKNFKKGRVYSLFKDNIWGVDLADIQLISK